MIEDLFVPVLTPFGPDGAIDVEALTAHSAWVRQQGANGVMLFGTTGEGPSVSVSEKLTAASQLIANLPDLQVIGSVTESSVMDAARCISGYNELPLAGTLILPPGYFREAASDGLRAFFERLVPTSAHPVLAYHIPSLAPAVAVDIVAELGMWGAKDSSGDIEYTMAVLATGKGVMVGAEATIPDAMAAGAAGTIAGTGNLLPRHVADICASVRAGDLATAYRLRDQLFEVQRMLASVAPGMEWVAAMKQLSGYLSGVDLGGVRLPLMARRDYRTTEMLAALTALSGPASSVPASATTAPAAPVAAATLVQ